MTTTITTQSFPSLAHKHIMTAAILWEAVLLAHLDAEEAADYSADWRTEEENLKALVEHFEWGLPKQPKVTGGESMDAGRVLLEVEGVPYDDGKMLYQVEMHKVDGAWRYVSSTTLGLLK